jgi:hypothetical protein
LNIWIAIGLIAAACVAPTAPAAAKARVPDFHSTQHVLAWIDRYRANPDPAAVPEAVKALSRLGAFREPENAGVHVGFMAGIIATNQEKADTLIGRMLSIRSEDHWAIVRAIAYSGHPGWRDLLRKFADRMPERRVMIDKHLDGTLARLDQLSFEPPPSTMDTMRGYWRKMTGGKTVKKVILEPTPTVLDTLWGYYFATGSYGPVLRIVAMLPWTKDRNSLERVTLGGMAKYTLASNAARSRSLRDMLKNVHQAKNQPQDTAVVLGEVIEAAETMETPRIRQQALASIEDLKRKGPGYKRDVSWWGQIGQGALAAGCVVAAATGQVEFGLPCVIGGGLSSAALTYWNSQ